MENVALTSWLALSIGFLHALEPGHGKTALFTYLASGKKTWVDGFIISFSSALTHSLAVFLIAFVSHYVLHHNVTEQNIHHLAGFLSYLSGGIIFAIGIWVIFKTRRGDDLHANCCGGHDKSHHHHAHNTNVAPAAINTEQNFDVNKSLKFIKVSEDSVQKKSHKASFITSSLIGIATGIIPCPTVIVAYLTGVSNGNSLLGVQSVILFAAGMFFALLSVVMFFNLGGQKILGKFNFKSKISINWGYVQGAMFLGIGVFTAFLH